MAAAPPRFEDWVAPGGLEELSKTMRDPPSVANLRAEAFRAFRELPLEPNPLYRKYGYFSGVDLAPLAPALAGPPVSLPPPVPNTIRIAHDASGTRLEIPPALANDGVRAVALRDLLGESSSGLPPLFEGSEKPEDRLSALGTALTNRGYSLTIPDDLERAVHVQEYGILSEPHQAMSVRRSIRVGRKASLLHTEEVYSTTSVGHQRLFSSSTGLDAGPDSRVVFMTVHAPDPSAVSVYQRHATISERAHLCWIFSGFGGYRTKARNTSTLAGTASDLLDLQTFFGDRAQQYDSSVTIRHVATDTHGQSITRGVFTGEARGMSRGLVRIEKEARRTISYISEHAMLLSKGARSDTIPILEILCRDVKATHSTSVAPVDPEKVFYLESRGISPDDSVRLIGEGFLSHVLERSPVSGLREVLYPHLATRWQGGHILWETERSPALPTLSFSGTEAGTDWRFDSKLR